MRKVALLVILVFLFSLVVSDCTFAGWKENYRTKYSKKQMDPNSEKAKKIRNICKPSITFTKWKKTPEERKALGLDTTPKTSLTQHMMPWKSEKGTKDQFDGYSVNFGPKLSGASKEENQGKTGNTLTASLQNVGKSIGDEAHRLKSVGDEAWKVKKRIQEEAEEVK